MIRLWFLLRRIRQRATPLPKERGALEVYLREQGLFEKKDPVTVLVQRVAAVALVVLVASVGVSSYAYASDEVLPDTPLYPVRQTLEQVEARLATTPIQKRKVVRKMVERRQKEIQKLKELKRPVPVQMKKYLRTVTTTTPALIEREERRAIRREQRLREQESVDSPIQPPEAATRTRVFRSLDEREKPEKTERSERSEQRNNRGRSR